VKSYGNDGSVEREEKQKRFSPLPTLPWEARKKPRSSHIPTAPAAAENFPFLKKTFNFNFDESVTYMPGTFCYRYPRSHNKATDRASR
jgi:hypothetical protein